MKLCDFNVAKSNNLHFIRFIAALAVILSHALSITHPGGSVEFFNTITDGVLSLGGISVSVFFVAGGFLIAKSASKRNTFGKYFSARVKRIFPPLAFTVVACILLLSFVSRLSFIQYFTSLETYKYLLNAFLVPVHELPGVFENNFDTTVNGALWTLPVEFICYIACFIFYKLKLMDKKKFVFTIPLAVIFAFSEVFLPGILASMVRPMLLFYIGMLFFLYQEYIDFKLSYSLIALGGLIIAFALKVCNVGMYLFFPYLLFAVSFGLKQLPDFLGKLGNYSYGIYLWGFPAQQILINFFGEMNPWLNFIFASLIAITLGIITNLLTEKPFEKRK